MMRFLKNLHRDTRGELMVEFAVCVILAFFAFTWLFEMGFTMYDEHVIREVAEQAADYAATHGPSLGIANCSGPWGDSQGNSCSDSDGQNIVQVVQSGLLQSSLKSQTAINDGLVIKPCWEQVPQGNSDPHALFCQTGDPTGTTGNITGNPASSTDDWVMVTVTWPYHPYIRWPGIPPTLSYSASSPMLN